MGALTDGADPEFRLVGICHRCARRRGVMNCDAYPEGIPFEILGGDVLHTEPYPGDGGLVFLPALT